MRVSLHAFCSDVSNGGFNIEYCNTVLLFWVKGWGQTLAKKRGKRKDDNSPWSKNEHAHIEILFMSIIIEFYESGTL